MLGSTVALSLRCLSSSTGRRIPAQSSCDGRLMFGERPPLRMCSAAALLMPAFVGRGCQPGSLQAIELLFRCNAVGLYAHRPWVAAHPPWLFLAGCHARWFGRRTVGRYVRFPAGFRLAARVVSVFHETGFAGGACHLSFCRLRKGCDRRECEGVASLVLRCRVFRWLRMWLRGCPCVPTLLHCPFWVRCPRNGAGGLR